MPPLALTLTVPVPPKHLTSVLPVLLITIALGSVIVTLAVLLHVLSSVTVTVYVPAVKLAVEFVPPLFDHKYVYGEVPPLAKTPAVPFPPLHNGSVFDGVNVSKSGSAIVTLVMAEVQVFASVTVTV